MNPQTSLRKHLIRGASGSLVLMIANTVLALLMAVVLARVLGVKNFGIYAFCMSVVQILTVPAMLGGKTILVRDVAIYKAKGDFHFLCGLLLRFRQASFLTSILLVLSAAGIGWLVYMRTPMLVPFLISLCLVPFLSAIRLQGAALRGLRYVLLGQMTETFRPALVLLIILIVYWFIYQDLGPEVALIAQLFCSIILVGITFFLLRWLLPEEVKKTQADYELSKWLKSAVPFLFMGCMLILTKETSVVMLGIMQPPEQVGLYRVAQRGASFLPFGLSAVTMVIAPTVAEMFAKGENQRLQRLINKSIWAILALALPVALCLILAGRWLLAFVLGDEYVLAYLPLVILCLGQMVNVCMGTVELVLNMTGLERFTVRGMTIAAIVNIFLNAVLIPFFGAVGAAIATSISLGIWNILLFAWLYRETGIVSTVFPIK